MCKGIGVEGLEFRVDGAEEGDACEIEEGGVGMRRQAKGELGHDQRVEGVVARFDCCS